MKKALKNKLENMLPDYISGDLDRLETEYFEREIVNFPHLEELVQETKAIYKRIDQIDYDSIFESKSQNLSVKAKLAVNKNRKSSWFVRYALAPIVILMALSVYYITDIHNQTNQNTVAEEIQISDSFLEDYSTAYLDSDAESTDETFNIKEDVVEKINNADSFFDDIYEQLSAYPELMYRYSGFNIFNIKPETIENKNLDKIIEEMQNDEII